MKKFMWALPMVVLLATLARAEKGGCMGCPLQIEGAKTVAENTADGVTIRVTGKDAAAVKRIQETVAEHLKMAASGKCADCKNGKACAMCAGKHAHKGGYVCPMGCARSDKPGKCPKCGMDLKPEEKKAEKK